MGNHQIPSCADDAEHIALQVLGRSILGRQQIAGPGIVTERSEGFADTA